MDFVDTNYFLRFLLKDDPAQHKIAKDLFLQLASGKTLLFTSIVVIFEVNWVLNSFYGFNKTDVLGTLKKILNLNFKLEERNILIQALDLYNENNLSLEDCFNLSFAKQKGFKEFKTFDEKLKKVSKKLN